MIAFPDVLTGHYHLARTPQRCCTAIAVGVKYQMPF